MRRHIVVHSTNTRNGQCTGGSIQRPCQFISAESVCCICDKRKIFCRSICFCGASGTANDRKTTDAIKIAIIAHVIANGVISDISNTFRNFQWYHRFTAQYCIILNAFQRIRKRNGTNICIETKALRRDWNRSFRYHNIFCGAAMFVKTAADHDQIVWNGIQISCSVKGFPSHTTQRIRSCDRCQICAVPECGVAYINSLIEIQWSQSRFACRSSDYSDTVRYGKVRFCSINRIQNITAQYDRICINCIQHGGSGKGIFIDTVDVRTKLNTFQHGTAVECIFPNRFQRFR